MNNFLIGLCILSLCVMFFSIIIFIRNHLVYKYRMKALQITSEKAKKTIESNENIDWIRFYDEYDAYGSYNSMLFDFRKWQFKDFYSGIEY